MKLKAFFTLVLAVGQLFAQNTMTPELLWKLGRVSINDHDEKNLLYSVANYSVEDNKGTSTLYKMNLKNKQIMELPQHLSGAKFLFNSTKIGGSINGRYMLADADGGNALTLANIPNASNWKALELTDGRLLLLFTKPYKYRQGMADLYPELEKANAMVYDDLMYRHWDSWTDEYVDHLCFTIADPNADESATTYTDVLGNEPFAVPNPHMGGSDAYHATNDGKYIVYSCKKKTGKEFAKSTNTDIYLYEIATGITTNLTADMPGYDNHPSFSPNGTQIAWLSMPRDGFESDVNQLWVYDMVSSQKRQTIGEEYVNDFTWVNDFMIAYQIHHRATQQIGVVDFRLKGKQDRIITSGDFNYGSFAWKGKTLIASRTDMNHAAELFNIDPTKGVATAITSVNDEIYSTLKKSRVEKRMIKTTDGEDMLTWVIYPPDFDPNKKYPAVLYCQGGPQSPVSQFYSFRWNFQLMAAKGYIVVAPNRRGVPGFGKEWNEAISRDWGGQAMQDYLSAIDEVAKEPFVDKDLLGAVGASYGGYSVYMLAGIHQGRFKALISHCGLFNLESWYGTTEEMFFANWDVGGPYWDQRLANDYKKHSPHRYVQNWTAPILVIHGGKDYRVPDTQGLEAFQAAQLRNIPSRLLYFPEEGHWVLGPQNGIIWHTEFFGWLDQWLKN